MKRQPSLCLEALETRTLLSVTGAPLRPDLADYLTTPLLALLETGTARGGDHGKTTDDAPEANAAEYADPRQPGDTVAAPALADKVPSEPGSQPTPPGDPGIGRDFVPAQARERAGTGTDGYAASGADGREPVASLFAE